MAQKMLFCFTKTSAEILLHLLGYNFMCPIAYFNTLLPIAVAIKRHKKLSSQKLFCFGTKNVNEIDN
jgi:hypothetical protein